MWWSYNTGSTVVWSNMDVLDTNMHNIIQVHMYVSSICAWYCCNACEHSTGTVTNPGNMSKRSEDSVGTKSGQNKQPSVGIQPNMAPIKDHLNWSTSKFKECRHLIPHVPVHRLPTYTWYTSLCSKLNALLYRRHIQLVLVYQFSSTN